MTYVSAALIIEKFHSLFYGVKDNPIAPDGIFTLIANPFNFGVTERNIQIGRDNLCTIHVFSFDILHLLISRTQIIIWV